MNEIQEQPILKGFVVFLSTPIDTSIIGRARRNQGKTQIPTPTRGICQFSVPTDNRRNQLFDASLIVYIFCSWM